MTSHQVIIDNMSIDLTETREKTEFNVVFKRIFWTYKNNKIKW